MVCPCSPNDTARVRTKSSESTSTVLLASLLERYEKTLHERQRAMAIANEQLSDIDDVLRRYRTKNEYPAVTTHPNTVKNFFSLLIICCVLSNEKKRKKRRKRNEALQSLGLVRALDFNSFFSLYTRINFFFFIFFRCQTRVCLWLYISFLFVNSGNGTLS